MDSAEKMQSYVQALEEERRKIQVFRRELPLCLQLVIQAIETCKQQLSGTTTEYLHEQSECSDHTSSDRRPVLEEFIPIKPCSDAPQPQSTNSTTDKKKSDWLRSVQLWNQNPDPQTDQDAGSNKETALKRYGGAFQPFRKEKSLGKSTNNNDSPVHKSPSPVPVAAASSSAETVTRGSDGKGSNKEEKEKEGQRKQRRCWSPELHRRFLQALQQLGGSHAATPKQIREHMKVEGLTNDEVKSHLQKYRLHTRRPSSSVHNNVNQQAPQFVVVGGIWVPPAEYAAVPATTTTTTGEEMNTIYTPVAVPATVPSEEKETPATSHSQSQSTSSSTHTTTASHVL